MDFTKLKRDPQKVLANFVFTPDHKVICKDDCRILFPVAFTESGLATVGVTNSVVGYYCTVVGDYYGISMVPASMNLNPTQVRKIKIGLVEYYELFFIRGSVVISNTYLVKNDLLLYKVYLHHIAKGKVPPYFTYDDMAGLFDLAKKYTGSKVGSQREVTELIVSTIARKPKDMRVYYRQTGYSGRLGSTDPAPAWIKMNNVVYGAVSTLDKLTGAYAGSQGIVAALNHPSERVDRVEGFLRS